MSKKDDFVFRCINLNKWLNTLKRCETSDRVWISVMSEMITEIIIKQDDPRACFNQFLEMTKSTLEEKSGSPEEESAKD